MHFLPSPGSGPAPRPGVKPCRGVGRLTDTQKQPRRMPCAPTVADRLSPEHIVNHPG